MSMWKHGRYTALFLSLHILQGASQHSFECLYYLPESFPKSPSLWQFNSITWSKHCNSGTYSQVYTWHQTFYLIKYHATLGRYIHIYYRFSAFTLVCGVYSYSPPLRLPQPKWYSQPLRWCFFFFLIIVVFNYYVLTKLYVFFCSCTRFVFKWISTAQYAFNTQLPLKQTNTVW